MYRALKLPVVCFVVVLIAMLSVPPWEKPSGGRGDTYGFFAPVGSDLGGVSGLDVDWDRLTLQIWIVALVSGLWCFYRVESDD